MSVSEAEKIPVQGAGITAEQTNDSLRITMPYNASLIKMIQKIEGATYEKDSKQWIVPLSAEVDLAGLVGDIRKEAEADLAARADIESAAQVVGAARQEDPALKPKISDYHEKGKNIVGEIVAVNSRYAAQFTGNGKQDGVAFIVLHRLADLDQQVTEGEDVVINYNDKGRASAKKHLNVAEREAEFDENLGKSVDGVKVTLQGGKYRVEFDYNEALSDRLRRVDTATFNKDAKVWEVGTDVKAYLVRAVGDMQQEYLADREDRKAMEAIATSEIDKAIIKDAFTKDGTASTGEILGKNSRYVLQHSGKEYAVLHRPNKLAEQVRVGQNVRIEYKGDMGQVTDKTQSRAKGVER